MEVQPLLVPNLTADDNRGEARSEKLSSGCRWCGQPGRCSLGNNLRNRPRSRLTSNSRKGDWTRKLAKSSGDEKGKRLKRTGWWCAADAIAALEPGGSTRARQRRRDKWPQQKKGHFGHPPARIEFTSGQPMQSPRPPDGDETHSKLMQLLFAAVVRRDLDRDRHSEKFVAVRRTDRYNRVENVSVRSLCRALIQSRPVTCGSQVTMGLRW